MFFDILVHCFTQFLRQGLDFSVVGTSVEGLAEGVPGGLQGLLGVAGCEFFEAESKFPHVFSDLFEIRVGFWGAGALDEGPQAEIGEGFGGKPVRRDEKCVKCLYYMGNFIGIEQKQTALLDNGPRQQTGKRPLLDGNLAKTTQ